MLLIGNGAADVADVVDVIDIVGELLLGLNDQMQPTGALLSSLQLTETPFICGFLATLSLKILADYRPTFGRRR